MSARFRNPVQRDQAWARFYRSRGLAPVLRGIKPTPNPLRRAAYETRKALSQPVRC